MDSPHRRAANSRVPPLHLPQGACTRLCVLAQAKRSTANARALGVFGMAEPLMQRTGRLPVQVECCASGMPYAEQFPARSRTPSREGHHHRMRLLPEQAEQSTPCALEQHFDDGTCQRIDHCRASRNFTQEISEANFLICSLQSPVITAFHSRLGPIENGVRCFFRCFKSLFLFAFIRSSPGSACFD